MCSFQKFGEEYSARLKKKQTIANTHYLGNLIC